PRNEVNAQTDDSFNVISPFAGDNSRGCRLTGARLAAGPLRPGQEAGGGQLRRLHGWKPGGRRSWDQGTGFGPTGARATGRSLQVNGGSLRQPYHLRQERV